MKFIFYVGACIFCFASFLTFNKQQAHARTAGEYAAIFVAPDYYLDPDKLFGYGYDIGLMKNCRSLDDSEVAQAKINLGRWVKLASTEFEPISSPGVLNSRLHRKAMEVVEKGIRLGTKEGKQFKNSRSFRNECGQMLDAFGAPPGNLGK